ncbi:MAG: SGNH/GDSL hydrolase family protein [Evtepia sp.]
MSFFDNAVFIGDSISMTLEAYCGASGALGQAKFLCAGGMSPTNMLTGQILPEYPKGSGQKPAIQDSVAATGAKYVYVMLGMDNIAYGIERSTNDYMTILKNILDKNPDVQIIIQSVTPMADKSKSYSEKLNNGKINEFNETMKAYCEENKWYYVNVAEAFRDENGFLKKSIAAITTTGHALYLRRGQGLGQLPADPHPARLL